MANRISSSLLLIITLLGTFHGFSQEFVRNGNIVTYRGNKFEYLPQGQPDTQTIVDPVTNKKVVKITTKDPVPTKMNGIRIYNTDEVDAKPAPAEKIGTLELYIVKGLSTELNKLSNGNYFLYVSNVIVDDKGKVVYYEYDGLTSERNKNKISADVKKALEKQIDPLLNSAPGFTPGKLKGRPVIVRTDIMLSMFRIAVKNHKATMVRAF
jgi:hypothetical protein